MAKNIQNLPKVPKHWLHLVPLGPHLAPLGQAGSVCLRLATHQTVKNTQICKAISGRDWIGHLDPPANFYQHLPYRYRYLELFIFLVVTEKFGTGKCLGTGIGKIWYPKKVLEAVSEKFGPDKSTGIGIGIGIENIWCWCRLTFCLGIVTHCSAVLTNVL